MIHVMICEKQIVYPLYGSTWNITRELTIDSNVNICDVYKIMFRMIKLRSNKMYGFSFLYILTQIISTSPLLSCRLRNHIVCMDVLI